MLRPRLLLDGVEPYIRLNVGMEWYVERIDIQGTNWGFPLSAGIGARFRVTKEVWVILDWQGWHESNGTKVFGHNFHPNPGVNTDLWTVGIEIPF